MKRSLWVGSVLLLLVAGGALPARAGNDVQVTARHGQSLRGTIQGQAFLLLRGTHEERGFDHGYLAAREIVGLLNALLPALEGEHPGTWEKRFTPALARFVFEERYEKELAGMLAGIEAALPGEAERRIEVLGRPVRLADLKLAQCLSDLLGMGCSSFSAWGKLTADGQPITGRNLDYIAFPIARYSTILAVEPAEAGLKPTIDLMFPGSIGAATAMNADGVFAAIHDGAVRDVAALKGAITPRMLAIRSALETADAGRPAEDMAEKLRVLHPAMSSSIHVSGPVREGEPATLPGVLEWDMRAEEGGVTVRRSADDADPGLVCTNHFVARGGADSPSSSRRFKRLTDFVALAERKQREIGLPEAQKFMGAVAISGQDVTLLSCVVWPAERKFALAVSPQQGVAATKGQWMQFTWQELMGAR